MGNYGAMQDRIASEVLGSVLASDITNAIQDAILFYERRRFWFNEKRIDATPSFDSTGAALTDASGNIIYSSPMFTTVAGTEFYDAGQAVQIGSFAHIDKLILLQASNRYTLNARTPQWADDQAVGLLWRAIPTDWSYAAQAIRLYPIPDAAYPIYAWGTWRFSPLANRIDSNPWTNEAELLIRSAAEFRLYKYITRNDQMTAQMEAEVARAEIALERETAERGPPMRFRPTQF